MCMCAPCGGGCDMCCCCCGAGGGCCMGLCGGRGPCVCCCCCCCCCTCCASGAWRGSCEKAQLSLTQPFGEKKKRQMPAPMNAGPSLAGPGTPWPPRLNTGP